MARTTAPRNVRSRAGTPAGRGVVERRTEHDEARSAAAEIGSHAGDPNYMASLARGLAVIRAFSQQRTRMTIAQLSLRTGIPRAAVRRVLYTLSTLGYVASDDGRA